MGLKPGAEFAVLGWFLVAQMRLDVSGTAKTSLTQKDSNHIILKSIICFAIP